MAVKLTSIANVTVAAAGTAIQIYNVPLLVNSVFIQAHENNTGNIYIGDENVSSGQGTAIGPGQPFQYSANPQLSLLSEFYINDIWVDAEISGDKVRVAYLKRKGA